MIERAQSNAQIPGSNRQAIAFDNDFDFVHSDY
jgi:hypothetical protein